jgi:hypothetical protein
VVRVLDGVVDFVGERQAVAALFVRALVVMAAHAAALAEEVLAVG